MSLLLFLLTMTVSQHLPVGTELTADLSPSHQISCSPSLGSMAGRMVVEQQDGSSLNLTNVSWQLGLGSALCYKFQSSEVRGTVEVSYVSLKTIYSVLDSYRFPLVSSYVSCLCDCPGGSSETDNAFD